MANGVEKHIDKLEKVYEEKEKKKEDQKNLSAFDIITNNTVDEMEVKSVKQNAFEEGIKQLFDTKNLRMKTDLSAPLILAMARGEIFVDIYKSRNMANFINSIQTLNVSKGRKGRSELVALVRNSQDIEGEVDTGMTGIAKLMGR